METMQGEAGGFTRRVHRQLFQHMQRPALR
jgi:hypothetical protein